MGGADRCSEIKIGLLRRLAATTVQAELLESKMINGEAVDVGHAVRLVLDHGAAVAAPWHRAHPPHHRGRRGPARLCAGCAMTLVTRMFVTDAAPMRDPARERERERVLDDATASRCSVADPGDAELKRSWRGWKMSCAMFDRGGNGKDV